MPRFVARLVLAVLVVAGAGLGVPGAAQAATCSSGRGVSVVVDFHQLGGGVQTFCDADGAGETGDAQFRDANHQLTYVQRQPGFVCRVDGVPADDPCVNTPPSDSYWSVWWSDGTSGRWTYSSLGVASLEVPEGGYVALSWQGGDAQAEPRVSPTPHTTQPSSSPSTHQTASPHPSSGPVQAQSPSSAPGTPASSGSDAPRSPADKAGEPGKKHVDPSKLGKSQGKARHGPDAMQAAGPIGEAATDATDSEASGSGGLPGWVAPLAVAVLFVGAGTIVLVRRKSSGAA